MSAQGLGTPWIALIALRLSEASSSDYPPDKKVIPGSAGTIERDKVLTVNHAISYGLLRSGQPEPGVTMLGLSKVPSIIKWCFNIACITAVNTRSDTSAQISIV